MDWERWAVERGRERSLEANADDGRDSSGETRPRTLMNFYKSWHMMCLWFSRSKCFCLWLRHRQEKEERRDWLFLLSDWLRRNLFSWFVVDKNPAFLLAQKKRSKSRLKFNLLALMRGLFDAEFYAESNGISEISKWMPEEDENRPGKL